MTIPNGDEAGQARITQSQTPYRSLNASEWRLIGGNAADKENEGEQRWPKTSNGAWGKSCS